MQKKLHTNRKLLPVADANKSVVMSKVQAGSVVVGPTTILERIALDVGVFVTEKSPTYFGAHQRCQDKQEVF